MQVEKAFPPATVLLPLETIFTNFLVVSDLSVQFFRKVSPKYKNLRLHFHVPTELVVTFKVEANAISGVSAGYEECTSQQGLLIRGPAS